MLNAGQSRLISFAIYFAALSVSTTSVGIANVIFLGGGQGSYADDRVGDPSSASDDASALPFHAQRDVVDGSCSVHSEYDYDLSGIFRISWQHSRGGEMKDTEAQTTGNVGFTIANPMTYEVTGEYAFDRPGHVLLSSSISVPTSSDRPVFEFTSGYQDQAGVVQVMQQQDRGSPIGTLEPGTYNFFFEGMLINAFGPDAGAAGNGFLQLKLTELPDPASSSVIFLIPALFVQRHFRCRPKSDLL